MKIIVGNVIHKYNTVMEDYTKNTGGGDGDEALYIVWKERKDAAIVNYDRKIKGGVYLTIVHMWNKQFNFPLVTTKDPIPDSCQVDDGAGDNISNLRSPSPSPYSTKVASNRQEDSIDSSACETFGYGYRLSAWNTASLQFVFQCDGCNQICS